MKKKYAFHPSDYAIGETEKFYSDMARKGWELEKRGGLLSRFKKTEPKKLKYRIELSQEMLFEHNGITDEQISIFEGCGWSYVTGVKYIHVFCSPETHNAPEPYLEPQYQSASIKVLRNHQILSFLIAIFFLLMDIWLPLIFLGDTFVEIASEFYCLFIDHTIEICLGIALILWTLVWTLRGILHLNRLYRNSKKGIPIDHSPKRNIYFPRILLIIIFILAYSFSYQYPYFPNNYEMLPTETDSPCILISDIANSTENNKYENDFKYSNSLICEHWKKAYNSWDMLNDQNVFKLKLSFMRKSFSKALMIEYAFADSTAEFTEVKFPGLDYAWISDKEFCIAVKDDLVYVIRYNYESDNDVTAIFQAIADKDYE